MAVFLLAALCGVALAVRETSVRGVEHLGVDLEYGTDFGLLCNDGVVAVTCTLITQADDASTAPRGALGETLAADNVSMDAIWELLGFHDGEEASCQDLCVRALAQTRTFTTVPSTTDMACYKNLQKAIVCDLNVAKDTLKNLLPSSNANLPDLHDKESEIAAQEEKEAEAETGDLRPKDIEVGSTVSYKSQDLLIRIANLFRVYPYMKDVVTVSGAEAESSLMQRECPALCKPEKPQYCQTYPGSAARARTAQEDPPELLTSP